MKNLIIALSFAAAVSVTNACAEQTTSVPQFAENLSIETQNLSANEQLQLGVDLTAKGRMQTSNDTLKAAIAVLEAGLIASDPKDEIAYATAQRQLAVALSFFGNRTRNPEILERAISLFETANATHGKANNFEEWSTGIAAIANAKSAYLLINEQDDEFLEFAIGYAYNAVDDMRARAPLTWAKVQHNVGQLLSTSFQLERGKFENFEQAESAFLSALEIYDRETHAFDWARVHADLSRLYLVRAISFNDYEYAYKSVTESNLALDVLNQQQHPYYWATAISGLARAQFLSGHMVEQDKNFGLAEGNFIKALETIDPAATPHRWHEVQLNLTYLLSMQEGREKDAAIASRTYFEGLPDDIEPSKLMSQYFIHGNILLRLYEVSSDLDIAAEARDTFEIVAFLATQCGCDYPGSVFNATAQLDYLNTVLPPKPENA